jgi:RNA recognition motif-containing protein
MPPFFETRGSLWQLPWSTSNEDLVDLFTTIGPVKRAEIQYEPSGRSRGSGVVEFDTAENAETAICACPGDLSVALLTVAAKFTGYQYGGRPLGLSYVRYSNASGDGPMETDTMGLTQDQIM